MTRTSIRKKLVLATTAALTFGLTAPALATSEPTTDQLVGDALVAAGENTPVVSDPSVFTTSDSVDVATDWGALGVKAEEPESVVREQKGGAQVISVLDQGETSARFDLELPGNVSLVDSGVGYDVVVRDKQYGAAVLGQIEAPWAIDAEGNAVKTDYELQGDTLVQRIYGEAIKYPVVADPSLVRNCGILSCSWYFSVVRTQAIADMLTRTSVNIASNLSVGMACAVIAGPSGPGAAVAGTACTVVSAVGTPLVAKVFNDAKAAHDCVRMSAGARSPLGRVDLSSPYCDYS